MGKTVFILGAGASRITGTPLMAEFLDRAYDLFENHRGTVSAHDFELVFELVDSKFTQLLSKSAVDLSNIESLFNIVEMGSFLERLPMTPAAEIARAHQAVATVIAETIEETCLFQTSREGMGSHIRTIMSLSNPLGRMAESTSHSSRSITMLRSTLRFTGVDCQWTTAWARRFTERRRC